ncbi:MAG: prepilin-type N-terminal cleavage/methylation domain [Capsulimonas sp.]|nr:prepilin-type N-terminal cleavage/methylation domain [Capsulimonas sp.]
MKRQGFTLIELLVVIAIIMVLAAILFPVFGKVREKARQTSCMSNQKQLGLAVSQYTQDNDEYFPGVQPYGVGWAGSIYPYVKSKDVYTCLDDSGNTPSRVSYGFNANLTPAASAQTGSGAVNSAGLTSDSKTVMLFEVSGNPTDPSDLNEATSVSAWGMDAAGGGFFYGPGSYATGDMGQPSYSGNDGGRPGGRHTDGSCFLFADSHVKWLRPSAVSPGHTQDSPDLEQGAGSYAGNAAGTNVSTFTATFSTM